MHDPRRLPGRQFRQHNQFFPHFAPRPAYDVLPAPAVMHRLDHFDQGCGGDFHLRS